MVDSLQHENPNIEKVLHCLKINKNDMMENERKPCMPMVVVTRHAWFIPMFIDYGLSLLQGVQKW